MREVVLSEYEQRWREEAPLRTAASTLWRNLTYIKGHTSKVGRCIDEGWALKKKDDDSPFTDEEKKLLSYLYLGQKTTKTYLDDSLTLRVDYMCDSSD